MSEILNDISIRLQVLNPQRQPLGGTVDIELKPQGAGDTVNVKGADASKDIDISGLQRHPQGNYQVTVTPTDVSKPASQLVTVPARGFNTVVFNIDKAAATIPGLPGLPGLPGVPGVPAGDGICIRLSVLNPLRQPLGGTVDIDFKALGLTESLTIKAADASKDIDVSGLVRFPKVVFYVVTVTPTNIPKPSSQSVVIPPVGFNTVEFIIDEGTVPPPFSIPDQLDPPTLGAALTLRLSGNPADGSRPPDPSASPPSQVIWVDNGDEVLVHLDSTKTQIVQQTLLVSVDLETDQTGRQTMVVVLALGDGTDNAGLVGTTDELPRGNALLAARWGQALQASVWAVLMQLAQEHAFERSKAPRGLIIANGLLNLLADVPLQASTPPPASTPGVPS